MIEVLILPTRDRAEADSPEGAVCAARTMIADAIAAHCVQGYRPTATFLVAGRAVASNLTQADLGT